MRILIMIRVMRVTRMKKMKFFMNDICLIINLKPLIYYYQWSFYN